MASGGTAWLSLATGELSLAFGLALAGFAAASLCLGAALCAWLPCERDGAVEAVPALALGMALASVALLALAFSSPLSTGGNLAALGLLSVAPLLHSGVRERASRLRLDPAGALALAVAAAGAAAWSRENLAGLRVGPELVSSHPWIDVFYHASQIALFARSTGADALTDPSLAGQPLPLYHYGSYLVPAALAAASRLDAYALACAFYAPFGLLLAGLSAFTLGAALFPASGGLAGLAALGAVLLVPDPSFWSLGNRWTSYFFFQQVGIGGAHAVALLGLAAALAFQSLARRSLRHAGLALGLVLCSALFKVQLFLVYGLPAALAFGLCLPGVSRRWRALGVAAAAAGVAVALGAATDARYAPTAGFGARGSQVNLEAVARYYRDAHPALARELRARLEHSSYGGRLLLGAPLLAVASYGVWLPALAWVALRARGQLARPVALFPWLLLANHGVVALGLAPNEGGGDPFELIHKTFVWPYFGVAVWVGAGAAALLSGGRLDAAPTQKRQQQVGCGLAVLCALGLPLAWYCGGRLLSGLPGAHRAMDVALDRGLYDCARFVRGHTPPGAVVQTATNDGLAAFAALGERASFVRSPRINPGAADPEVRRRFLALHALLGLDSFAQLRERAAALGIDALVLDAEHRPAWAEGVPAAFASRGCRVYLLAR